jgi:hypothetical protein
MRSKIWRFERGLGVETCWSCDRFKARDTKIVGVGEEVREAISKLQIGLVLQ